MYQIAIGDDRVSNAIQIKKALQGQVKGIKVVELPPYEQGILDFVKKSEPEVVMIGVNAAGFNGMETVREIRKFNTRTQIILISEAEHTSLLKEGIALKISSCLLEPLQDKEVCEAVENAILYFGKISREKENPVQQEELLKETLKYVEYSFIYTALLSACSEAEYKSYKKLLKLEDYGYILNIEIAGAKKGKVKDEDVYDFLKSIISEHKRCVVGPRVGDRIIVFAGAGEREARAEKANTMDNVRMAAHIIVGMEERFGLQVLIGIGGVKPLVGIHLSYEEALRCIRYRGKRNVVEIRDIEEEEISREEYMTLEDQFLKSIRLGTAEALDLFTALLDSIRPLRMEIRRNKVFSLLVLADYEARIDSQSDLEYFPVERAIRGTEEMNSDELERWAYNKAEHILNAARSNRVIRKSEGVKNAIRYMEENYMEPICLRDISEYTGISPQHFSRTFKEETGVNYIDWLTRLRMENAKKMMAAEKSTVKEVCYMVGYNDPSYFSRIFKKTVGVSPTEYVNEILPNNNN